MISLKKRPAAGFTIVELLIVIVVIGILAALVVVTYNGIQQKARDTERKTDINALHGHLEAYNAQNGRYPLLADVNDSTWRGTNMKGLDAAALQDPKWAATNTNCTAAGAAQLQGSATPASGCYGFTPTATDGSACDNSATDCLKYTLIVTLEAGGTYSKTSLQ